MTIGPLDPSLVFLIFSSKEEFLKTMPIVSMERKLTFASRSMITLEIKWILGSTVGICSHVSSIYNNIYVSPYLLSIMDLHIKSFIYVYKDRILVDVVSLVKEKPSLWTWGSFSYWIPLNPVWNLPCVKIFHYKNNHRYAENRYSVSLNATPTK